MTCEPLASQLSTARCFGRTVSDKLVLLIGLSGAGINLGSRLGYEPEFHLSTARLLGQAPSGDEVSHRVTDGRGTGGRGSRLDI